MTDSLIRKEDAIKALGEEPMVWTDSDFELADRNRWEMDVEALKKLPPVQVEPLTDREQRIFLAAMSREKEVCKEVDYQFSDVREPYEDTLVSVCKEIERKVKAALWTN